MAKPDITPGVGGSTTKPVDEKREDIIGRMRAAYEFSGEIGLRMMESLTDELIELDGRKVEGEEKSAEPLPQKPG